MSIGVVLFWLVYKDQDMSKLWAAIKNANLTWLIVALLIGLISHISRAMRWILLMKPLGYKPRLINVFFSVMVMYLANIAIPRSGEVTRCGLVTKYEKVPFTQLLGTVFTERIIDFLMLCLLLCIVLVTQFGVVLDFFSKHPEIQAYLSKIASSAVFLIILGLFVVIAFTFFYLFKNKIRQSNVYKKVLTMVQNFGEGMKTVRNMEDRLLFIAHSVFIWILYFLMIYVSFWAFDATSHLTVMTSLTVFVMASFGMVAPAPGGVGTWHFMVIETLFLFGVAKDPDGNAFALAAHGMNTLMMVVTGFISLIGLPLVNKQTNVEVVK